MSGVRRHHVDVSNSWMMTVPSVRRSWKTALGIGTPGSGVHVPDVTGEAPVVVEDSGAERVFPGAASGEATLGPDCRAVEPSRPAQPAPTASTTHANGLILMAPREVSHAT